jgi:peptidoglycan hydrolase CwlO-like protein
MKTNYFVNTKILVLMAVFVFGMIPATAFADSVVPVQYLGPVQESEQSDVGVSEEQSELEESIQAESVAPIFPDPADNEEELVGHNDQLDELSQIKAENNRLKQEIDELKQEIQNLQQIVLEQLRVMVQTLGIGS